MTSPPPSASTVGSQRLQRLPAYVFAEMDRRISQLRSAGVDVISLGIGDPDLPTPEPVVEALRAAAGRPRNHRYPSYNGLPELRRAMAAWYLRRFKVELDADGEILPLIGSKEGIGHLPLALLDPGDLALVPDPGYPVYAAGAVLAGADWEAMRLLAPDWLPDLGAISEASLSRARLLWLNYPNNPTGATVTLDYLERAADLCRRWDVVLAHDAPYTEITFGGYRAPSVLQVPAARDVAVEFHSLSKTYNMTGWRVGMAVGRRDVISRLATVKENLDSGIFQAVQEAAMVALQLSDDVVADSNAVIERRQRRTLAVLQGLGWSVRATPATFYLWFPVPAQGVSSMEFAAALLDRTGVAVTPGTGFGAAGEGFLRISLTVADERLDEALERVRGFSL